MFKRLFCRIRRHRLRVVKREQWGRITVVKYSCRCGERRHSTEYAKPVGIRSAHRRQRRMQKILYGR